jgi:hypothetical protein
MEEVQVFKSFEAQQVTEVNYYFWNNTNQPDAPQRMLYFLELLFANDDALILTSGQDSEAIRVTSAVALIEEARFLQAEVGGKAVIGRVPAGASALWAGALEHKLAGIRLSKSEAGLYYNDALLLDFGAGVAGVVVAINPAGGLAVAAQN